MNPVERFFKMLMKKISKLCNNSDMCVFLMIALMGFVLCSLLGRSEGFGGAPFPDAFMEPSVAKDPTSAVVGQVPTPNRAKASASLQAEVAALPDPDINNFIRQSSAMDKEGSINLIQVAPLVQAAKDGDQEAYVRWTQTQPTPPTNGNLSGAVGNGSNVLSAQ